MNLQELKAAITAYRQSATEEQLEAYREMLSSERDATDEALSEISAEREAATEEAERQAWSESEEGKEEAEYFANAIQLWYRTETQSVTINGDRRRPNQWEVWIGYEMHTFIGTTNQVIHYVESLVGTGTPYSPNPNGGAKSWRYRWYSYHDSEWLDYVLQAAA